MKRLFFVLVVGLFLVIPTLASASAYIGRSGVGEVEGFVYDALTSSRLMGVRVEAPQRGPLYTDHLGYFRIKNLPVGVTHLVFRLGGYVSQEEVFVVYEDERVYLAVFMWPIDRCPWLRRPILYYYSPPPPLVMSYPRLSYPARDWWYRWYYYPYIPCCYYLSCLCHHPSYYRLPLYRRYRIP